MWLLFVLHKVFPPLFVSFLNSLPVIACTTLLLGVLLIHSEPNTGKHGRRRRRGRTTEDYSVSRSLEFRNEDGLEANSIAASCFEQVSEQRDADSDEWHEIDQEQDDNPSDFKSVAAADDDDGDDEERSDSSVDGGVKDGGENRAVSWSEDDRRILVWIGNSELERNRRLERVIAIRKARRAMMVDENSTDTDGNGGDEPNSSETDRNPDATVADRFRWFAESLASVEEHESQSREVSVIEEADVIGDEVYRARGGFDFRRPIVSAAPAPVSASVAKKKTLLRSSVVSMRMKD